MPTIIVRNRKMSVEEIAFKYRSSLFPNELEHAAKLSGYVEKIYSLNPGLAASGQLIPIGTKITMPEVEHPREVKTLKPNRLWG